MDCQLELCTGPRVVGIIQMKPNGSTLEKLLHSSPKKCSLPVLTLRWDRVDLGLLVHLPHNRDMDGAKMFGLT